MKSTSTGSPGESGWSSRSKVFARIAAVLGPSRGFSLIETLAALTILSIALAALYGTYGHALRIGEVSSQRLGAVQLAQSLLSRHQVARALKPEIVRGSSPPYQWEVAIEPVDKARQPGQQQDPWRLYSIGITVSWPSDHHVHLESLHLARAP